MNPLVQGGDNSPYLQDKETTASGGNWIDISKYTTTAQKTGARNWASANGVFPADDKEVQALRDIDSARSNADMIEALLPRVLYSGSGTRALGGFGLSKAVTNAFQSNEAQQSLKATALSMLKDITSLSSVNRVNKQEISQAEATMPKDSDTIETGMTKLAKLRTMLDNAEKAILGRYAPQYQEHSAYSSIANQLGGIQINQ